MNVFTGASRLILPVRQPRSDDTALKPFEPSESSRPLATTILRPGRIERSIKRDVVTGEVEFAIHRDDGRVRLDETGTVLEFVKQHRYRIRDDDPLSAVSEVSVTIKLERDGWRSEVRSRCVWTATRDAFLVRTDLDVFDGEERMHCRSWSSQIARDLV